MIALILVRNVRIYRFVLAVELDIFCTRKLLAWPNAHPGTQESIRSVKNAVNLVSPAKTRPRFANPVWMGPIFWLKLLAASKIVEAVYTLMPYRKLASAVLAFARLVSIRLQLAWAARANIYKITDALTRVRVKNLTNKEYAQIVQPIVRNAQRWPTVLPALTSLSYSIVFA
jgi:hypothetical protein